MKEIDTYKGKEPPIRGPWQHCVWLIKHRVRPENAIDYVYNHEYPNAIPPETKPIKDGARYIGVEINGQQFLYET